MALKGKLCVLLSGGFDSAVLAAYALRQGCEVFPLFVRAGYAWERAELYWTRRLLGAIAHPRLRPLAVAAHEAPIPPGHWARTGRRAPGPGLPWTAVELPGRNLLLLSQAAVYCRTAQVPAVALAVLKGNPFSDATPEFRRRFEAVARSGLGASLRVLAPFSRMTKKQVARLVPDFPAKLTFSCLSPRGLRHCGACAKCEERGWVI